MWHKDGWRLCDQRRNDHRLGSIVNQGGIHLGNEGDGRDF